MSSEVQKLIDIELEKRALYAKHGFKNGHDYYNWREKVYAEIPKDFKDSQGGFEITWGEEPHIARKIQMDKWVQKEGDFVIHKPKLVFKRIK